MPKKSVQKRVSDASKKRMAKAKLDTEKARQKQKQAKLDKAVAEKKVASARWSMYLPLLAKRKAQSEAESANIKSGRSEEVKALRDLKAAKADKMAREARTGESMKAHAKKKRKKAKPKGLRPGTSNPY